MTRLEWQGWILLTGFALALIFAVGAEWTAAAGISTATLATVLFLRVRRR